MYKGKMYLLNTPEPGAAAGSHRGTSMDAERVLYWASSRTSIPEMVALLTMGSKIRFSFPCALGFR